MLRINFCKLVLLATVCFIALAFSLLALPPQSGPSGSIEGIVVRLGSNDPISEVDVELTRLEGTAAYPLAPPAFPRGNFSPGAVVAPTSPNPSDMPSTRTNQDGRFVFRNLKPGTYRLLAARGGGEYYPAEYGQHGPKGHGHNFQLAESQTMKDIRLEMAATGAISGRVFDADGAPVGRVQVMALEASYQSGQRTLKIVQARDTYDRGAYRLFWLPPGRYYIAARPEDPRSRFVTLVSGPPGFFGEESYAQPLAILRSLSSGEVVEETYDLVYSNGETDPQKAQPVDLHAGSHIGDIDLFLAPGRVRARHVRGVVIDGVTGRPVANAQVRAAPRNIGPSVIAPAVTTDANGLFDISGVAPGAYFVRSSLANGPAGVVPVAPGERNVENVTMLLSAGFTVTGRIVFEGRPANGANPEVSALRVGFAADNRFLPSGVGGATATDGAVTITGIHAGDYHVNVNPILTTAGPPPAVPAALQTLYVKSIRLGVDDVLNSGAHISGPPTSELQIVVGVNGGVLEGRVADDQQRPAINAMVVLVPAPFLRNRFDLYKTAATDTAGHFRLQGIAPGDYKIFAWHYVEDGLWCEPEFIRGYEGRGKTVRIEEGNNGSIDVSLIRE